MGLAIVWAMSTYDSNRSTPRMPGSSVSDSAFNAARNSTTKIAGEGPFSAATITTIGWPDGIALRGQMNLTTALSSGINHLWTGLLDPWEVQWWIGFIGVFLTGVVIATIVRIETRSPTFSLLALPMVSLSAASFHWWQETPEYTHVWLSVLALYLIARAFRNESSGLAIVGGITSAVAMLWVPYFVLWVGVGGVVLFLLALLRDPRKAFCIVKRILILPIAVLCIFIYVRATASSLVPVRSASEAEMFALRFTTIFGDNSYFYVAPLLVVVLLALIVTRLAFSKFQIEVRSRLSPWLIDSGVSLVVLVILSMPPRISGVPTPGIIVPSLVPQFRHGDYVSHLFQVGCVLATLVILSTLGIQRSSRAVAALLTLPILAFATIDGARKDRSGGERWMNSVYLPEAVSILNELPPGPVVNYPWDISWEVGNTSDATPCFRQWYLQMPLVNMCDYSTDPTPTIVRLRVQPPCSQVATLYSLGVRYIFIDFVDIQPRLTSCLGEWSEIGRAQLIFTEGNTSIWEFLKSESQKPK
jgi:hypothetical protein